MLQIGEVLKNLSKFKNQNLIVKGWVVEKRVFSNISFFVINDGSCFENLQVVSKDRTLENQVKLGSIILVEGVLKSTPSAQQSCEVFAKKIELLSQASEDFLLQKNLINLETLREYPHLRHRTKTIRAVMRIRSRISLELHKFFDSMGLLYIQTPILTSNDGEGAGETFEVFSENKKDFFGVSKKVFLTVTGQLHAEAYAQGFGGVYTFGPTFRAEVSHTSRHAAEFWMIEPEIAFFDLHKIVNFADKMLKTVISNTLRLCKQEFDFLEKKSQGLLERLNKFVEKATEIVEYRDAINILKKHVEKFKNQKIEFGLDMSAEHEKFIVDYFGGPVAVVNFPKAIKAFYMLQNSDEQTVASFDLLVPGIGELIGGSQRETRIDRLTARAKEVGIDLNSLEWYLSLRRFGFHSSSGFGLGLERLVMYVTGIENIRDVIPFPRTAGYIRM